LKQSIEIWSRGQGEPDDFILRITLVTCWYEGGSELNGLCGGADGGIHVGILNILLELKAEKVFQKCDMHSASIKDSKLLAFDLTIRVTSPQKLSLM